MRVVTCDLTTWLLPACCLLLTAYCMICYQGERGSVAARFRWLLVVACCLAGAGVGSACRIWMRLRPGRWRVGWLVDRLVVLRRVGRSWESGVPAKWCAAHPGWWSWF